MSNFAEKLDELMIAKGNMANTTLAELSGISDATISYIRVQKRDPKWSTCLKIMSVFPDISTTYWMNDNTKLPNLKSNNRKLADELLDLSGEVCLSAKVRKWLSEASNIISHYEANSESPK